MEDLSANLSTVLEGTKDIVKNIQEYMHEMASSDEEEEEEPIISSDFLQNNSPDTSLILNEQSYTRTTSSDTFTRASNSDTAFPETPENHLSTSSTTMNYRTLDPFNPKSYSQTKRKSPQHSSLSSNEAGHRTVISDPNEGSPKRYKSRSSSTPLSDRTTINQSPEYNPQLKTNHTPSPSRQTLQQPQPQQFNSTNRHEYNNSDSHEQYHEQHHHQQQQHHHHDQLQTQQDQKQYHNHLENQFAVPQYPSVPITSRSQKLGDKEYLVLNRIGFGASSQVYSAYSIKDERCYALKYIEIKRKEDRANAVAEIDLLKSLINVERVAALRYYYSIPKAIYLIMELGEIDLAHLIKRQSEKGWDYTFICYYWEQMVKAVHEIHSRNVVHCDLKPANFVLIRGVLKLIDFGISKALQDDTTNIQKDSQVGTFNYMSPESFRDVNEQSQQDMLVKQGRASDIWALGCILYLMIYGHTPFSNIPMPNKVFYIMDSNYQIPFGKSVGDCVVPDRAIGLLRGCLERDKHLRPTATNLLRRPLYQV